MSIKERESQGWRKREREREIGRDSPRKRFQGMPDGGKPTLSKIPAFPRLGLESNEDGFDPNDMSFFSCNAHARDQTNVSLHLVRERERERVREREREWMLERECVCVYIRERESERAKTFWTYLKSR